MTKDNKTKMSETLYAITKSSRDGKAASHLLEFYRDTEQEEEEKIEKFSDYLLRGFLSSTHPNGYKNWSYAEMLASGETDDTTNNAAEALNSQFGKFALSGVTSYAQMLTRTYEFHIEYTESCAEKRQNDKMNKRSEKINKKNRSPDQKTRKFPKTTERRAK